MKKKIITQKMAFTVFLLFLAIQIFAEGSVNFYPKDGATGKRAFLQSRARTETIYAYDLFPTQGTMKVYVKVGETLYLGSSSQGYYNGQIKVRKPSGATASSTLNLATGRIANRTEETYGPDNTINPISGTNVGTAGYTPYTLTVDEEGIWEVDFIAAGTGTNAKNYDASADWVGATTENSTSSGTIAAFDISVGSASNAAKIIPGRVYCNNFNGNMYQATATTNGNGFFATYYVLTDVGYVYRVKTNGQNGASFNLFVNNKGIQTTNSGTAIPASPNYYKGGTPSKKSTNAISIVSNSTAENANNHIYDPRQPDNESGVIDVTHKIFFSYPASDLPTTPTPISYFGAAQTTTWLLKSDVELPEITNLDIIGAEGGDNGVIGPDGAKVIFHSSVAGKYKITLSFGSGYVDRVIEGYCIKGDNSIPWNGKDATTPSPKSVSNDATITVQGTITAGEVHFPMADVEINPQGMVIELLQLNSDQTFSQTKDIVYWDDTNADGSAFTTNIINPPVPTTNLTGISSNSNGHKWGIYNYSSNTTVFGNEKILDTWSYVADNSDPKTVTAVVKKLDLAVTEMTATPTTVCAGAVVTYTVKVSNLNTNTSYVDATGATFGFVGPTGFVITNAAIATASGVSETSRSAVGSSTFTSLLNLTKGSEATYTITGYTNTAGSVLPYAYILRPSDVIEIDLLTTNPTGVPSDPFAEYGCSAATIGTCTVNNVKTLPSAITVNALPTTPTVSMASVSNACPSSTVNLTSLVTSTTPSGGNVYYKTTNDPLGTDVANPASVGTSGTYYIFYSNSNGCYSSGTSVTVTITTCIADDINQTPAGKAVSGNPTYRKSIKLRS